MNRARPEIAVVVVSDDGGRSDGDRDYLRATLRALAARTPAVAMEVLPAAFATAVYVHALGIGGMRQALAEGRGDATPLPASAAP